MTQKFPRLSYITTCKGRLAHLQQTLPRVAGHAAVNCIVVDYGCPDGAGDWVESNHPEVSVVRSGAMQGFNASTARNLGVRAAIQAGAEWLAFFDADIMIAPGFFEAVLPALERGFFYRANPVTLQTWGSIIVHSEDFVRAGGYDEAYSGWGGEDDDLMNMLTLSGVRCKGFPSSWLSEISHSDAERTRFATVQDKWVQSRINQTYLNAKLDLIRLRGEALRADDALALYAEIEQTLRTVPPGPGLPWRVQVHLPATTLGSPPHEGTCEIALFQRTLVYNVAVQGRITDPGIATAAMEMIGMSGPSADPAP